MIYILEQYCSLSKTKNRKRHVINMTLNASILSDINNDLPIKYVLEDDELAPCCHSSNLQLLNNKTSHSTYSQKHNTIWPLLVT